MTILEEIIPEKYGNKQRFTKQEVAEILGYSLRWVEWQVERGELLYIRVGRCKGWYTRRMLESYLQKKNGLNSTGRD